MIVGQPEIVCDICKEKFANGQGYGLRSGKSKLQYTKNLTNANTHICNGCMCAIVLAFEDSCNTKYLPEMRY